MGLSLQQHDLCVGSPCGLAEMTNVNLDLDDLTNAALKRLVKQLLAAEDGEEQEILDAISSAQKESDDLADLSEEKRGSPRKIAVDDDTPKKKGKR